MRHHCVLVDLGQPQRGAPRRFFVQHAPHTCAWLSGAVSRPAGTAGGRLAACWGSNLTRDGPDGPQDTSRATASQPPDSTDGRHLRPAAQQEWALEWGLWSQVVAVGLEVPADVVAIWSQS